MISLTKLITTDVDATVSGQTAKTGGDSAQDFLALLAGALGGNVAVGEDADGALSLNGLQAANGKSAKNLRALTADNSQTPAQKLADLLARQTSETNLLTGDENAQVQNLLLGLTPAAKNDVLAALTKGSKASEDTDTALNDEELSGLSALMAMLPHQQTAQLTPKVAASEPSATVSTTSVAANRSLGATQLTGQQPNADTLNANGKTDGTAPQQTIAASDNAFQNSAALAMKKDADNASLTVNTSASIAPAVSHGSAAQASAPVSAAVLSAPLGSNEWQQTLSQHVTLFTRQGQQNAELRLHPEELGQIQISLKIDDKNMAQLQMMSPHSHVRQALEAALPTLRTSLAESGIQLGQSNISSESFAGQQQQSFSGQQQSSRSGSGERFAAEDDESLITPASLQSVARGNGAVDIFA